MRCPKYLCIRVIAQVVIGLLHHMKIYKDYRHFKLYYYIPLVLNY